jgi:hypothetical protein
MRQIWTITVMLAFSVALHAQQPFHFRTTQDGAFAQLNSSTENTSLSLEVDRATDSSNGRPLTTINYLFSERAADGSSISFTQVFGTIPNGAFSGENTKRLILDVDTSQLDPANLVSLACTETFFPESGRVCGPAPTGLIHLEFHENGIDRFRILASQQERIFGLLTLRTHRRSDFSSADSKGSFMGMPVENPSAFVGVNHEAVLDVVRNP